MDTTVNVVNLTAVIPGYRPIAQLYINSRSAVDRAVREKNPQPALKIIQRQYHALCKLWQFRKRCATVKNIDIGTIPARSVKPCARSYVLVAAARVR